MGVNPHTELNLRELDLRELQLLGRMLDRRHRSLGGRSTAVFLAQSLLRVRGKDGRVQRLKANAVQREFELRRGVGNIVLKARQMGLTTWIAGRFLLKTVTQPGTLTLQVAHTQESAEEILRIVHRFVELLPEGLRVGALRTAKSNVRQIVFPLIDSEYRVVSAADRNAGRGMTVQNLHCSEVARWGSSTAGAAGEILAGLRACLVPEGEQVLESTPNGAQGCFYSEWQRADDTGLVRHFFPWWLHEGYRAAAVAPESLTEEERELMKRVGVETGPETGLETGPGLDLEQIGYRRRLKAGYGDLARQEYVEDAETCFRASGESYFDLEAIEKRLRTMPKPIARRENGKLEIWLPPQVGRRYLVAVDPAGGGSEGDFSAIQVLDLELGKQCAEFAGHVGGLELMELCRRIAGDYETAWLVVERNNHGSGLLALLDDKRYPRVYKGTDGAAGFLTSSVSRPQMLARMSLALRDSPEIFHSAALLAECRSFERLRNGGMGARSGAHDDRVMAMAVGLEARVELLGRRV